MICDRSPLLDLVYSPQVQACTIAQRKTSDDGERPGSCKSQAITKVEQRSGDGTDEDGEFQPREESTLGCQLDLGFDTDRDVNTYYDVSTGWRWDDRNNLRLPFGALKRLTSPFCFHEGTPREKPPSPTSVGVGLGIIAATLERTVEPTLVAVRSTHFFA